MPNKERATGDSGTDMVNGPGMVQSHRRKRSAAPSPPRRPPNDGDSSAKKLKTNKRARSAAPSPPHRPPNDGDSSAKKLKTNKRARSASPSLPHRSPTNSNRSAKKSKRTHHSDDAIPFWMGEASASTRNNGPSPVPSPAPIDSRSPEKKDQQAYRTVNHKRTRSASPSLPHRPPIDSVRSAKKLKSTHNSGDTIPVPPGEEEEEEGVSRHDNDPYPVPSLPPIDSISTERNQQAHTGIVPTSEKPHESENEVVLNLSHRPKPTLEMPDANMPRLPQKTRSVFSEPKSGWKSVSVGWDFGGPPSWRERDDWNKVVMVRLGFASVSWIASGLFSFWEMRIWANRSKQGHSSYKSLSGRSNFLFQLIRFLCSFSGVVCMNNSVVVQLNCGNWSILW